MGAAIDTAWTTLGKLPADKVCQNSGARFDVSLDSFILPSFGQDILICPTRREMKASSPGTATLLEKSRYFAELAILHYLAGARNLPLSGKLIRPSDLKSGQIFAIGSHVLPLDRLAQKYGRNIEGFLTRGQELKAQNAGLGDASLRLMAFPRVPAVISLWKECEEFPARADLLFDASCELHMPQDIVWATAMISILILM